MTGQPRAPLPPHALPFGDTGWSVWRDVLLRTPGFPVDGLARLRAPEAAAAVDAHLRGECALPTVELDAAARAGAEAASDLAADPLLREALTWQNRSMLTTLDRLARDGAGPEVKLNSDRRQREEALARYWQRYCAKNETVGFFGPACWGTLDTGADRGVDTRVDGVLAEPGPGLTRARRVFFEQWAVRALAEALADADEGVRDAFRPRLAPHARQDGRTVVVASHDTVALTAPEAAVLARCDGRTPAADVLAATVADGTARTAADARLLLARLVERGVARWDANLPLGLHADDALLALLPAAGPARATVERLRDLRDDVAAAAGDPDRLGKALAALDAEFSAVTGHDAVRRGGETYAGRTLVHEETTRDLDLALGPAVIEPLVAPLTLLLQAARWLTAELARAYGDRLRALHDELAADTADTATAAAAADTGTGAGTTGGAGGRVLFADVWFFAQGLFFGPERPADEVTAEFTARWARLLGLDAIAPGTREVALDAADLAARVAEVFPATRPGWSAGRLHSPDLHLCARDVDAIRAGEFTWVLGELHAAWATFDVSILSVQHPDESSLARGLAADLGARRVWPLWPVDWPRSSGRLSNRLGSPGDVQLGFTVAEGADPDRLVPAAAAVVERVADAPAGDPSHGLRVVAPDGSSWPLLEAFSALMSIHAVDAFKLVAASDHTPRVTVGSLVVQREAWRTSTAALDGLLRAKGLAARFVEARRWRRDHGLPERVYVRIGTETKPVHVDFASPLLVSALCVTLRSAHARFGDTSIAVSEMLPGPEHAWTPDAHGGRYLSELRLQLVDPARPAGEPS